MRKSMSCVRTVKLRKCLTEGRGGSVCVCVLQLDPHTHIHSLLGLLTVIIQAIELQVTKYLWKIFFYILDGTPFFLSILHNLTCIVCIQACL